MDVIGWHLVRLVSEASSDLVGARIESLRYRRDTGRLLMILGSKRGKRFVIIGLRREQSGFFWAREKSGVEGYNDYKPTERLNRLRHARLIALERPSPDRLLRLRFERQAETETETNEIVLWLAWMGGRSNVWLVDPRSGTILETLAPTQKLKQGETFEPPAPPGLLDWTTAAFPEYWSIRSQQADGNLDTILRKKLWGIDRALAKQISNEGQRDGWVATEITAKACWREFEGVISILRRATDPRSPIIVCEDPDSIVALLPSTSSPSDGERHTSLASALAALDREISSDTTRKSQSDDLRKALDKQVMQLRRRLADVEKDIANRSKADEWKRFGDLLGANRHMLKRGMTTVEVTDWQSGVTTSINLDGSRSPQQNIDDCYKRARKLERAADTAAEAMPGIKTELARFEGHVRELESPDVDDESIESIRVESGLAGSTRDSSKSARPVRLPYKEFVLHGYTVLVGRSNRDNDELTRRIARPDDLFLHADQVSGSHVVVRSQGRGKPFPQEVIAAAAQLAALYSKARHSGLVPVIYTEVRHVSKPRKAAAGLVRVSREKSIMVKPGSPPGYHDSVAKL